MRPRRGVPVLIAGPRANAGGNTGFGGKGRQKKKDRWIALPWPGRPAVVAYGGGKRRL